MSRSSTFRPGPSGKDNTSLGESQSEGTGLVIHYHSIIGSKGLAFFSESPLDGFWQTNEGANPEKASVASLSKDEMGRKVRGCSAAGLSIERS